MIGLLITGIAIAICQAIEVLARIHQIIRYQEKFSTSANPIQSVTAGQSATGFFILGSMFGLVICYAGIRKASQFESLRWKTAFIIPLCSTAFFGATWIALIVSPFVDLHAR